MPRELERRQERGDFHFVTFSCAGRKPYLRTAFGRDLFERSLEKMRVRYEFCVAGYVVMPEHVHLLVSEPKTVVLGTASQALKLSVSVQSVQRPFWLARYHDFNVFSTRKREEKVTYIHQNPVSRGLVGKAEDWRWSSFRHYALGEVGTVEIESELTALRRERAGWKPRSQKRDLGHPDLWWVGSDGSGEGLEAPHLDFEMWVFGVV